MENNYLIIDEWLIFKSDFNEELTDYYDIINKYNKIMFNNNVSFISEKNEYANYILYSIFNQEINLSNNIHLTHLTFGYKFNKDVSVLITQSTFLNIVIVS